jgi:hypothetical protein
MEGSYKRPPAYGGQSGGRRPKRDWNRNSGRKNPENHRRQKKEESPPPPPKVRFNKEISENLQQMMAENTKAIREFKRTKTLCSRCGEEIENIAEALCDRQTGEPVHFDCVLSLLREQEPLNPGERIVYIGQGRFAVTSQGDQYDKSFHISRIIEWENETVSAEWRKEISSLFSQVK